MKQSVVRADHKGGSGMNPLGGGGSLFSERKGWDRPKGRHKVWGETPSFQRWILTVAGAGPQRVKGIP